MLWQGILRFCTVTLDLATAGALLLCGCFGAYGLWDNAQVLASAADVREELLQWKPAAAAEAAQTPPDNREAFAQLRKINPDVCGWITMDGTGIDFPVLQGPNNLSYISKDVFGNFSLAGSVFLDSRDDPGFEEPYGLLYGHHMADGNMFGDLDNYLEAAFFAENTTGQLILPDRVYTLEVIASMVTGDAEKHIFDPEWVRKNMDSLLPFSQEMARQLREEAMPPGGEGKFLALSTCSTEFTNARTVVLVRMEE